MAVLVFRQDTGPDSYEEELFEEMRKGRLRQGWSYHKSFDLRKDKDAWISAFDKHGKSDKKSKSVYEMTAGMLKVLPGDLLVVPKQPTKNSFTIVRAMAAFAGGEYPCYDFAQPIDDDFRHCLAVHPRTLVTFTYEHPSINNRIEWALRSRDYGSPVQFVRDDRLVGMFEHLAGAGPSDDQTRATARTTQMGADWSSKLEDFEAKDESDYDAQIKGGRIRKSKAHERLIRVVAERFLRKGMGVTNKRHPIDLYMYRPFPVIFEAKIAKGNVVARVRQAVGQLFWYSYIHGPRDADRCVLLDRRPDPTIISFVEKALKLQIVWIEGSALRGGPMSAKYLRRLGVKA